MMNINIKATHIELTDAIRGYVLTKLESVNKLLTKPDEAFAQVEVGKDSRHHQKGDVFRAEIHLRDAGREHYAVVVKDDLYAAIDELRDEIMEKVKSTKDKSRSKFRRGASKVKNFVKGMWPWKGEREETHE